MSSNRQLKNRNFGLTPDSFATMLKSMQAGDNSLFEEIFLRQFEETIHFIIRRYQADWQDAYDASMDGLLKFQRRLNAGKITYGNLRFLFTQIASQKYLDRFKKANMNDPLKDDFDQIEESEKLSPDTMEELNVAWNHLGSECQQILKAFYYDGIALTDYADLHGKTPAAVRKQKQRCLEKLREIYLNQTKTSN